MNGTKEGTVGREMKGRKEMNKFVYKTGSVACVGQGH